MQTPDSHIPMVHNILLVDDRPENLFSLESMLSSEDRFFFKASSGNEALKIAFKENLSLILLDVQMPEMDGFETAEYLKLNNKTKKIPIIFVTAINKESKYVIKGLDEGAIDYLFKPLDIEITKAKVSNLLRFVQLQTELEMKNEQLAALNNEKNKFLGMAAHDLRNPIGVIYSLSNFLKEDNSIRQNPKQLKYVNAIYTSSEFMLGLVNNLLDVATIEAGELKLDIQPSNVVTLIENNIELNTLSAEKKGIKVNFNPASHDIIVPLDPRQFEQVMNNLVSNAVKYSMQNTSVEILLSSGNNSIVISIKDEGQGIPAGELEKLFKPFQKTSVKSTAGEQSTGLGLSIVKKIVDAHKGKIWVESEVGKGSVFNVEFPV